MTNRIAAASLAPTALALAAMLAGCQSPEKSDTVVTRRLLGGMEIRVSPPDAESGSPAQAALVPGDSLVFVYSSYTDRGEEGDGRSICFHVPPAPDSVHYSDGGTQRTIVAFGTGMAPPVPDTLRSYDFTVVYRESSAQDQSSGGDQTVPVYRIPAYTIQGRIGDLDISGSYMPVFEFTRP